MLERDAWANWLDPSIPGANRLLGRSVAPVMPAKGQTSNGSTLTKSAAPQKPDDLVRRSEIHPSCQLRKSTSRKLNFRRRRCATPQLCRRHEVMFQSVPSGTWRAHDQPSSDPQLRS